MTLRALRTVLRAAWRRPTGLEALAVTGAMVGLALASTSRSQPWMVNVHVVATLLTTLLGLHLVQGIARQNHPHLARLMPAQRPALATAVRVIGVLGLLSAFALWAWLAPQERPVMPFVTTLLFWLGGCLALARAGAALLVPVLGVSVLLAARALEVPKTEALWAGTAAGAALVVLVMPNLMRRGDAAHAAQWRRQRNTEALLAISLEGGKLGALQGQGWLARVMAWWLWPTRRMLHAARTPVASPAQALQRAQWTVNPSLNLAQQGWMLLTVALPLTVACVLPGLWRPAPSDLAGAWGQGLIVGMAMWFCLLNLGGTWAEHWSTRGEQALLRLVPGMPQGAELQRGWSRVVRRHALGGWGLHAGLGLAAALWWEPSSWPHAVAGVLLPAPAALLLPLFRWSHQTPPRGSWMGWATAWAFLSALVVVSPGVGGPALWPLTVIGWLVAAAVALRWHRRPRPSPWPAGHACP